MEQISEKKNAYNEKKTQKLAVRVKKKVVKKKNLTDALRKNLLRRKAPPQLQD